MVCNDQPDQAHVVRASGGGKVVAFEAQAFAQAMLELFDQDPAQRARQAQGAREWVRRHRSYDVISERVAAQLRAVAREHAGVSSRTATDPAGGPTA